VVSQQHAVQSGATRLEFAIVTSVIVILTTVLLSQLMYYRAEAERVAVGNMVGALRTALAARTGELLLQHKEHELSALAGQNPMLLLRSPPANYGGELAAAPEKSVPGKWYFDRQGATLVYLLNSGKIFGHGARKRLRFKVEFNAISEQKQPRAGGVSLVQLD